MEVLYRCLGWMQKVSECFLICNVLLSFHLIFINKKEVKSIWGWLLFLGFLPIPGFFLYLMTGVPLYGKKFRRMREVNDAIPRVLAAGGGASDSLKRETTERIPEACEELIRYNLKAAGSILTANNEIVLFTEGGRKFAELMEDIRQARQSIHLEYYIIRNDILFGQLKEQLCEKVKEGVAVRLLYDSMGCHRVKKSVWKELQRQGVQVGEFFPPAAKILHWRLNYRNHRKLVIIDNCIGYLGGFNIGREYVGLDSSFGSWRDTHLRLRGDAVIALQLRFLLDWNYATGDRLRMEAFPEAKVSRGRAMVQVVAGGPDFSYPHIRNNYLHLIHKAKEMISIQTPYFIPDEAVMAALKMALLSGVRVRLMIPCKPDHPFVYRATMSYAGELLEDGAECYIFRQGFLHAKGLIMDRLAYCYGTANADIRSFSLNFEVNAVVYGERETEKMLAAFERDVENCTRLTPEEYSGRSLSDRLKERGSRLLSPLL
ncbi:MAG: cardiolipin synthase [Lachnospiraceae bacterium]|nr:cardiolipin synthase [Lachnospiraceae bacterium]